MSQRPLDEAPDILVGVLRLGPAMHMANMLGLVYGCPGTHASRAGLQAGLCWRESSLACEAPRPAHE